MLSLYVPPTEANKHSPSDRRSEHVAAHELRVICGVPRPFCRLCHAFRGTERRNGRADHATRARDVC